MSLKDELALLQRRRDAELRRASYTYARLKRDVERKISPAYHVRKHVWTSLSVAGTLGFLLAPGGKKAKASPPGPGGLLKMMLRRIPGLEHVISVPSESASQEHAAAPPSKHSGGGGIIADILMYCLGQLDWRAILKALTQGLQKHRREPDMHETPAREPAPEDTSDETVATGNR